MLARVLSDVSQGSQPGSTKIWHSYSSIGRHDGVVNADVMLADVMLTLKQT